MYELVNKRTGETVLRSGNLTSLVISQDQASYDAINAGLEPVFEIRVTEGPYTYKLQVTQI